MKPLTLEILDAGIQLKQALGNAHRFIDDKDLAGMIEAWFNHNTESYLKMDLLTKKEMKAIEEAEMEQEMLGQIKYSEEIL